jgi:hypothetical protein
MTSPSRRMRRRSQDTSCRLAHPASASRAVHSRSSGCTQIRRDSATQSSNGSHAGREDPRHPAEAAQSSRDSLRPRATFGPFGTSRIATDTIAHLSSAMIEQFDGRIRASIQKLFGRQELPPTHWPRPRWAPPERRDAASTGRLGRGGPSGARSTTTAVAERSRRRRPDPSIEAASRRVNGLTLSHERRSGVERRGPPHMPARPSVGRADASALVASRGMPLMAVDGASVCGHDRAWSFEIGRNLRWRRRHQSRDYR